MYIYNSPWSLSSIHRPAATGADPSADVSG